MGDLWVKRLSAVTAVALMQAIPLKGFASSYLGPHKVSKLSPGSRYCLSRSLPERIQACLEVTA